VLPISDRHHLYAQTVRSALRAAGLRAEVDSRSESVGKRIRDGELAKVPYLLVAGDREAESGSVSVRARHHGDQGAMLVDDLVARLIVERSA
jgi:threonyl-tRNA synthetase